MGWSGVGDVDFGSALVEPVVFSVWHVLERYVVWGGIPDNKACMCEHDLHV